MIGRFATGNYIVELAHVSKVFHTHHFFTKNEDTGKRPFHLKKTIHAVQDVAFGIKRGEVFGLLGPNGAGKTTCVKMVSGLVRPTAGKVYVDGMDVERKRLKVLRQVGVVLEGTRTCIWPLTPLENLAYFGNLKDVRGPVLKKRSRELLDFIGLKDKMNTPVRLMSRGQKQKLAICIALIADPEVILLDEPTTGLDVQSSRSIKDRIIEMTRTFGKCALVTTHDMSVAQELCDRIGIINKGALVACKPTGELISLFSDLAFEFQLDRVPDLAELKRIPGVLDVAMQDEGRGGRSGEGEEAPVGGADEVDGDAVDAQTGNWQPATGNRQLGTVCVVRLDHDRTLRSEALYVLVDRLRAQGLQLRSVTQRQQSLEDVFLRLTDSSM